MNPRPGDRKADFTDHKTAGTVFAKIINEKEILHFFVF